MKAAFAPAAAIQSRTALAKNSGGYETHMSRHAACDVNRRPDVIPIRQAISEG